MSVDVSERLLIVEEAARQPSEERKLVPSLVSISNSLQLKTQKAQVDLTSPPGPGNPPSA